jgi:hypothetical protein
VDYYARADRKQHDGEAGAHGPASRIAHRRRRGTVRGPLLINWKSNKTTTRNNFQGRKNHGNKDDVTRSSRDRKMEVQNHGTKNLQELKDSSDALE